MKFVVEVITIGGGLPGFLGASFSGSVFSVSLNGPAYNISSRTAYKTPLLCCSEIDAFVSVGVTA
jgi:hypothetical protein